MTNQENRSTILEYIFRHAPVARSTIARSTQITPATVTSITGSFLGEGIIREIGSDESSEESSPGRKRILLDIVPDHVCCMGVEFTSRHVRFSICDLRGVPVSEYSVSLKQHPVQDMTSFLTREIRRLLAGQPEAASRLAGIGIAVPGHIDRRQEKVITNSTTYPNFNAADLRNQLGLPVICENNVRCMAFGRYLFDRTSPETFAFFHVGPGMFCALIQDSGLFHGSNYYAGEIGHTIVNPEGRKCECGKYGCLQTYSSETWLLKYARALYDSGARTILTALKPESAELSIEDVAAAYSLGDPLVGNYISTALKYLGITVSNLAIIMNPDRIYLHGALFSNPDISQELMDYIRQQLLFVSDLSDEAVQILPYEPFSGARGAAAYAAKSFYISCV